MCGSPCVCEISFGSDLGRYPTYGYVTSNHLTSEPLSKKDRKPPKWGKDWTPGGCPLNISIVKVKLLFSILTSTHTSTPTPTSIFFSHSCSLFPT